MNILIVDDNPSMARTLVDILSIKGLAAQSACSAQEALDILRRQPIHILLTDVIMPEMDGVALYREAKKIQPKLTTILMTAYAADELIEQGLAEGIKTVLTKPLDVDFLLTLLITMQKFL
jgi:two-component system, NtrC family, response regulator HydG